MKNISGSTKRKSHESQAGLCQHCATIGTGGGGLNKFGSRSSRGVDGQIISYKNDSGDPHSLSDDWVNVVYEDQFGELWVGTADGLNKFDRETEQFIRYQQDPDDPYSLSNNQVNVIYEDRAGVLWIGTRWGGLNKLVRDTGQFIPYRHDPDIPYSLSDEGILSLFEDHICIGIYLP